MTALTNMAAIVLMEALAKERLRNKGSMELSPLKKSAVHRCPLTKHSNAHHEKGNGCFRIRALSPVKAKEKTIQNNASAGC